MTPVESPLRSVMKSVTWRVCATLSTMIIVFAFTKELVLSVGVGAVEVTVKLVLYYVHERVWQKVKMGKGVCPPNPTGGESDTTR